LRGQPDSDGIQLLFSHPRRTVGEHVVIEALTTVMSSRTLVQLLQQMQSTQVKHRLFDFLDSTCRMIHPIARDDRDAHSWHFLIAMIELKGLSRHRDEPCSP
jgi:hypothetical protein